MAAWNFKPDIEWRSYYHRGDVTYIFRPEGGKMPVSKGLWHRFRRILPGLGLFIDTLTATEWTRVAACGQPLEQARQVSRRTGTTHREEVFGDIPRQYIRDDTDVHTLPAAVSPL